MEDELETRDLIFESGADVDGDLSVYFADEYTKGHINKDEAASVIAHLQKVFNL